MLPSHGSAVRSDTSLPRAALAMAAAGLAIAPFAPVAYGAAVTSFTIPICGDGTHVVTIPVKGGRQLPANDCPSSCHALCARRLTEEIPEEDA